MFRKGHILHRDVSVNNIMFEVVDGELYFILIDFDNAKRIDDDLGHNYRKTSNHRTGTLPFMDPELIFDTFNAQSPSPDWSPIVHVPRHDFASVFFTSLWCAESLPVKGIPKEDFQALIERAKSLESGKLMDIVGAKALLCDRGITAGGVKLPKAAQCLLPWFDGWSDLFLDATVAKRKHDKAVRAASRAVIPPPTWIHETCNGAFTYDKLKDVLEPLKESIGKPQLTTDEIAALTGVLNDKEQAQPEPTEQKTRRSTKGKSTARGRGRSSSKSKARGRDTSTSKSQARGRGRSSSKPVRRSSRVRSRAPAVAATEDVEEAPAPAPAPVDNDIRSRLRPRKPRAM